MNWHEQKVSPKQVEDLFRFCEENGADYYDVQIELVDHLASAIEERWIKNPRLTYNEALWKSFDEFGIYGFSKVRKAKEKGLHRKYFRKHWSYVIDFFKIPKVVFTFALYLIIYTLVRFSTDSFIVSIAFVALMYSYMLVYRFYIYPRNFKIDIIGEEKFLLLDYLKSRLRTSIQIATLPVNFFIVYSVVRKHVDFSLLENNIYWELIMSGLVVFFLIVLIAFSIYAPKRIREDFINEFPQFVKA